jgi:putative acetyltransferase
MISQTNVTVREATPLDAREILEVHRRAVHQIADSHYDKGILDVWSSPVTSDRVEAFVDSHFNEDDESTVFIPEGDADIIGFSEVIPANQELRAVYVHPDHTGQGVGRSLLKAAENEALKQGVEHLQLHASLNSVGFYEALGYRRLERDIHTLEEGTEMPCVVTEKRLSSSA